MVSSRGHVESCFDFDPFISWLWIQGEPRLVVIPRDCQFLIFTSEIDSVER